MAGQEQHDNGLGQAQAPQEVVDAELEEKFDDLDFSIHKSIRYHQKLASFYGVWRDWFRIVTVVAGSGAFFIVLVGWQHLSEVITGFVGLWAILDIVIRPDKKHDLHAGLRRRFIGLAIKLQLAQHTNASLAQLTAQRFETEADEPPCKELVNLEARNDEIRGRGWSLDDILPLTKAQRRWGYYTTFGLQRLEDWKAGTRPAPNRWRRRLLRIAVAITLFGLGALSVYTMEHRELIEAVRDRLPAGYR